MSAKAIRGISRSTRPLLDLTAARAAVALGDLADRMDLENRAKVRRALATLHAVRVVVPPLVRVHLVAARAVLSAWKTYPETSRNGYGVSSGMRSEQ